MSRTGNVRRLHSGCGFIAAWRPDDSGWTRRGARRPTADSLFFAAADAQNFDDLREGDRVGFEDGRAGAATRPAGVQGQEGPMTTIETVYGRLRDLMTDDFEKVSSRQYKAASDPFSFDLQPRSDFDAWYVDPPATRSTGYTSGVENVEAAITIWVSREAGEDAAGAAVAIAGDLARLRHLVIGLDFDAGPVDVNVHESVDAVVQPRREGEVVVIGRLAVALDYDTDGEHP